MATFKVTGKPRDEIEQLREQHNQRSDRVPFEQKYCLAKIPKQPDDYDGPDRFCVSTVVEQTGASWRCRFHGGKAEPTPENLDKLAAMKHGMKALREHVREDFDEKDRALYDWVVEEYPAKYDMSIEESPADAYDIHRLAVEIVRAERGRGFLLDEGEVHETPIRDEEGAVVVDGDGEVKTEKSEHYLAKMMHRQDKKLNKLEKQLDITRRSRNKRSNESDAVDAIKTFSDVGAAFLDREDKDYDPDDQPWEDE